MKTTKTRGRAVRPRRTPTAKERTLLGGWMPSEWWGKDRFQGTPKKAAVQAPAAFVERPEANTGQVRPTPDVEEQLRKVAEVARSTMEAVHRPTTVPLTPWLALLDWSSIASSSGLMFHVIVQLLVNKIEDNDRKGLAGAREGFVLAALWAYATDAVDPQTAANLVEYLEQNL